MQVLRNGLLADTEVLADLSRRTWLIPDQAQYRSTARLRKRPQSRIATHMIQSAALSDLQQALTCTSIDLCNPEVYSEGGSGMLPASGAALKTARSYHDEWRRGRFESAAAYLADALSVEVPINSYAGKDDFMAAAQRTRQMASKIEMLAQFGDDSEAVLVYDMTLPIGTLRIAELFTAPNGRITRIRHIHDTAALRAAGMGEGQ